ncbi:Arm DNA-binding domain-containing protein [Advenella incenata]
MYVTAAGGKYWRYDYWYAGKRKILAIGVYPSVTLGTLRERHAEAHPLLQKALSPGRTKRPSVKRMTRPMPIHSKLWPPNGMST